MKKSLLAISVFAVASIARAADVPLFPFVLPWDDASPDITNVSNLLDKPAGGNGFVIAKDGHLSEGGKRFRIFGVNTAFGANFPTHEDAEKVAARMAKFGINCVRFHHMDNQSSPSGIWSADMKTLDPQQLDKLDYFIAQLKKNGIYADLNLHVSRVYPGMPKWEHSPGYFKGVDNFYTPMIAMQRDYARQLLTHVNPYTKTAYADEPAVAIIEINNENGLISEWWSGSLDGMSNEYQAELGKRWNDWLASKYSSQSVLQKAWSAGDEPLGPEMLKEGAFPDGAGVAWSLEQLEGAKAAASKEDGGIRIQVQQVDGTGWHVQLAQNKLPLAHDRHYTVTFRARAGEPRRITVAASQAHQPWNHLWSANVELTGEWKEFRFTFQPAADEEDARIVFSDLGAKKGDCWLADVSLRPGGVLGLGKDERLGAIPLFKKSEFGGRAPETQRDWMSFLWKTEEDYWTGMERFLKDDLKTHSLIVGTATGFSPPPIQAKLDVVDVHAYWQHPRFPHKQWDGDDWTIDNIPMAGVPDGGTLPGLALRRVAGKPYICTEYNSPAPNSYSSEAFLLLNAYAALQDWDGVFVFAYSHKHDDWNSQRMYPFFDLDQHPTKLATLPAAVSMFLRGDIAPATATVTMSVTKESGIEKSLRSGSWWDLTSFGVGKLFPLQSGIQMAVFDEKAPASTPSDAAIAGPDPGKPIVSDTGELTWNAKNSLVTVNAPRNKAFIGRIAGGAVTLGDVVIEPRQNRLGWAAITVTAMDGRDFKSPGRILISATGYAENTGMQWKDASKNSVGKNWGTGPTLVEGIPAKITLPLSAAHVKAWALDERGQRRDEMKMVRDSGGASIEIGPQYKTLWYEVSATP